LKLNIEVKYIIKGNPKMVRASRASKRFNTLLSLNAVIPMYLDRQKEKKIFSTDTPTQEGN